MGSATGADSARASTGGTQRQYDNAYIQCMYAKGHRVPVPSQYELLGACAFVCTESAQDPSIPPPPPGAPPPPPTR